MDLVELRSQTLGIDALKFGRISSFIDFGNVNYWYEKDQRDADGNTLAEGEKLIVDISKLASFTDSFSKQKRFYYGWDARRKASWHLAIKAEQCGFIKNTKPIQFIRHYLSSTELEKIGNENTHIRENASGKYIEIPKGNFDVEISVDAMRLHDKYDTFCIFSGDSDFAYLARFLKQRGKKIIVVASGQVFHTLKELADLYINAQQIKPYITITKAAPLAGRGLDIGSATGGQGGVAS